MKWALLCTIEKDDGDNAAVFHFDVVENEIAAVESFENHIRIHGKSHIPYIYMTPYEAEKWEPYELATSIYKAELLEILPSNLFRESSNV